MITSLSVFSNRILPDVPGCPEVMVSQAVLNTCIDFCSRTWVVTRGLGVDVASSDINENLNYEVPIDISQALDFTVAVGLVLLNYEDSTYPLEMKQIVTHSDQVTSVEDRKFYYFDSDTSVVLCPIFSAGHIYIEVATMPTPTASGVDSILYTFWADQICSGAKARLFSMPQKSWSDTKLSAHNYSLYYRAINSAKASRLKGFSGKSLSVNPRSYLLWL